MLTLENRARLVRALVAGVTVDEERGELRIELADGVEGSEPELREAG